jgi:hypothetical protein
MRPRCRRAERGWPSFRRYARVSPPVENLRPLAAAEVRRAPAGTLTERHYRGRPYYRTLEFAAAPSSATAWGPPTAIAWTTFLRDEYRVGRRRPTAGSDIRTSAPRSGRCRARGRPGGPGAAEPVPANAALLRQNVARSRTSRYRAAVSNREGTLAAHLREQHRRALGARAAGRDQARRQSVACRPRGARRPQHRDSGPLELDCEGRRTWCSASSDPGSTARARDGSTTTCGARRPDNGAGWWLAATEQPRSRRPDTDGTGMIHAASVTQPQALRGGQPPQERVLPGRQRHGWACRCDLGGDEG